MGSTLRRKLKAGDKLGAAAEFSKWCRANGKVVAGLQRRRNAVRAMFLQSGFVDLAVVMVIFIVLGFVMLVYL